MSPLDGTKQSHGAKNPKSLSVKSTLRRTLCVRVGVQGSIARDPWPILKWYVSVGNHHCLQHINRGLEGGVDTVLLRISIVRGEGEERTYGTHFLGEYGTYSSTNG